jgi:hypothetical protein
VKVKGFTQNATNVPALSFVRIKKVTWTGSACLPLPSASVQWEQSSWTSTRRVTKTSPAPFLESMVEHNLKTAGVFSKEFNEKNYAEVTILRLYFFDNEHIYHFW